jgi:hypothetical protein
MVALRGAWVSGGIEVELSRRAYAYYRRSGDYVIRTEA